MGWFFLWPVLVPMIIPLAYCWRYKRERMKDAWLMTAMLALVVLLYTPVSEACAHVPLFGYALMKLLLFVLLPLGLLLWRFGKGNSNRVLPMLGLGREGTGESLKQFLFLMPVMIAAWVAAYVISGAHSSTSSHEYSALMFFESFTEEFMFRGILFLYLWKVTDERVAWVTSITAFVLIHPQYFWGVWMLPALVQAVLTAIIVRKSRNLTGAWFLHGTNRVLSLSVLPLMF